MNVPIRRVGRRLNLIPYAGRPLFFVRRCMKTMAVKQRGLSECQGAPDATFYAASTLADKPAYAASRDVNNNSKSYYFLPMKIYGIQRALFFRLVNNVALSFTIAPFRVRGHKYSAPGAAADDLLYHPGFPARSRSIGRVFGVWLLIRSVFFDPDMLKFTLSTRWLASKDHRDWRIGIGRILKKDQIKSPVPRQQIRSPA
ncbi:hypothetical protein EYR38_004917 [Pleurotus pulmonarius]|nr:hypothetical protein EYR38_004917 [Pleurotus pulmonarius]